MENYSASMGFMDENWQFHYFLGVHISNTIYEIPKYSLGIPVAKVDYDASLADLLLKGELCDGQRVTVNISEGELVFNCIDQEINSDDVESSSEKKVD